jgi:cell division protein FtsW
VCSGFFFFTTAAFGLLASKSWQSFKDVFWSQIGQGLFLGLIAMYVCSHIHYKHIRKISFFVFIVGCILCALVFVPGIGFGHGGAHRWIDLRFTTFQPSELLKLGFVLYFAMWLSVAKEKIKTFTYGTIPFLVFLFIAAALILTEPDAGTFGIIVIAGLGMFLVAGGKLSHITLILFIGIAGFCGMVYAKPYLQHRIDTFLNPESDTKGSGYQLDQALIAIGSGELFGRGFGQSIQLGSLP